METLVPPISLSFTLVVSGIILLGIGLFILIFAVLIVLNYIEWPWPISLFDPKKLGRFSIWLIYAGFGLLALGVLLEMAASYLRRT
jgi:hypothetical protein